MFLIRNHQERARLAPVASGLSCSVEIGGGLAANGQSYALFDRTPSLFANGPEVKA